MFSLDFKECTGLIKFGCMKGQNKKFLFCLYIFFLRFPASGTFPFLEVAASAAARCGMWPCWQDGTQPGQWLMMPGHDSSPLEIILLIPTVPEMQLEFDMGGCSAFPGSVIPHSAARGLFGKFPCSLSIPILVGLPAPRPKSVVSSQTGAS